MIPPFPPAPHPLPPVELDPPYPHAPPPLAEASPAYAVADICVPRAGDMSMESIFERVLLLLYRDHRVDDAVLPAANHAVLPAHHAPPHALVAVQYDTATATPFDHTTPGRPRAHPFAPPRFAPQVPVASAPPPVIPEALFPFLAIFAVPVRVIVPHTYIAYPAGLRTIPVLTVRLL